MSQELKTLNTAIASALAKAPVDEVLCLLTAHFVGLTVELVRRQGEDVTKPITIDGGAQRDITIHPPKDSPAKPLCATHCAWTPDNDPNLPGTYHSACGVAWTFTEGGPTDNDVRFCMGCGANVKVDAATDLEGDAA